MTISHDDETDWQRLFTEVEWLLNGSVPADQAAHRVGYATTASLIRAYQRHHRPLPTRLLAENAHNVHRRKATA